MLFNSIQEHLSYPDIKYLLQYIRSRKNESVKDELISCLLNRNDNTEIVPDPLIKSLEKIREQPCIPKTVEAISREIDLKETEQKIISYTDIAKTPSETGSVIYKSSKTKDTATSVPPASNTIVPKTSLKEVSDLEGLPHGDNPQTRGIIVVTPNASNETDKQKPSKVIFSQNVSKISVSPRGSNESIKFVQEKSFQVVTPEGSRKTVCPASSATSIGTKESGNSHTSLTSVKTIINKDSIILEQKEPCIAKVSTEDKPSDANQKQVRPILKTYSATSKNSSNSSCSCTTLNKCSGTVLRKSSDKVYLERKTVSIQEHPSKDHNSNGSEISEKSIQKPGSETAILKESSSGTYATASVIPVASIKSITSDISMIANISEKSSAERAAEKQSMIKNRQSLISQIYTKATPNPSNLAVTESGSLIPLAPNNSETTISFDDIELCELLLTPLIQPRRLRHLSAVTKNVSGTKEEKRGSAV